MSPHLRDLDSERDLPSELSIKFDRDNLYRRELSIRKSMRI